jgi:ABC-2 type transport system permease protein
LAPIFDMLGGSALLAQPRVYRVEVWTFCYSYFLSAELSFAMILLLIVGPNLISQDLRFNALPLYLSRPLRRIDYFFGKLGVVAAFLGMVIVAPSLLAYLLGLLFSLDISIIRDTYRILIASVFYGAIIALSAGTLMLALSSLSRNSRYIALLWLGVWFVSGTVSLVLDQVHYHELRRNEWAAQSAASGGFRLGRNERRQIDEAVSAALRQTANRNWRPLVSYRANLARIGDALLGTNACVERLGQLQPPQTRQAFLQTFMVKQYPWHWSAAVLAALFGFSLCILNFAIKSLDRLR